MIAVVGAIDGTPSCDVAGTAASMGSTLEDVACTPLVQLVRCVG